MKKRIVCLLLTLCMVVSLLPLTALAATETAQITGISITVDGVTYTEGNVYIKPDSTVIYTATGANLDKLGNEYVLEYTEGITSIISWGTGWELNADNTTATRDYSEMNHRFLKCENYRVRYKCPSGEYVYTDIYLSYDDGSTETDQAEITGLTLIVDGVTHTEGNVAIMPDSEVLMIVHGKYLRKADENIIIDTPAVYIYVERMTLEANDRCIQYTAGTWYADVTDYPITYTNDGWASTVESGITVTYVDSEKGTPMITDISITVDDVTYTEGNVIVRPDSTVYFTVTGEYLGYVDQNQIIDTPIAYLPLHCIPLQDDGTYIYTTDASVFRGGNNYNISYTNDHWATSVATDLYVTYHDGLNCEMNDWIVSIPPTFTAPGEQYRVCPVCGKTETETLEMLVGKVDRWNIVLEDNFKVQFCLQVSQIIENTAKVQLTIGSYTKTYDVKALEQDEEGYYLLSADVSAAQMNDQITVTVLNGTDIGSTETYSVRQYCDTILADDTHSEYHALVKQMLHYGAMAQIYFNYNTDNISNLCITDAAREEIPESVEDVTVYDWLRDVDFYGASLVHRDRIAVRYYFTGDITGLTFVANDSVYTPVTEGTIHYIEVPGIRPQDLDQQITLTVSDAEGNILMVTYGPMHYIVRMYDDGSDALRNLLSALYNYHLAAKAL